MYFNIFIVSLRPFSFDFAEDPKKLRCRKYSAYSSSRGAKRRIGAKVHTPIETVSHEIYKRLALQEVVDPCEHGCIGTVAASVFILYTMANSSIRDVDETMSKLSDWRKDWTLGSHSFSMQAL